MRAVAYSAYGAPEVLEVMERPMPVVGDGDILIAVVAAGINPADWRLRSGQFRLGMRLTLPFVPGSDVAGIVIKIGSNVETFSPGCPVFAMTPLRSGGACAEFTTVSALMAARVPTRLSLSDAAAIPLAGLTALQALRDHAALRPGHRLAVIGASGGVGHFAVQIGKALGAHVTAVCGTRCFHFAHGLGAIAFQDYADPATYAPKDRYDVVFDTVSKARFTRFALMLRPGGVVVTVNPVVGRVLPSLVTRLVGIPHLRSIFVQPSGADLAVLATMVSAGTLKPHVEQRFALADVAEAHRLSEAGHVCGKLVVDIAGPNSRGVP